MESYAPYQHMMQKLKSTVFEKFQIEHKVQNLKAMSRHPTFVSIMAAFTIVGLLSWLNIRPLCLLFLTLLLYWLCKTCCNLHIQAPREFEDNFQNLKERMLELRQTRPTLWSGIVSVIFTVLAFLGATMLGAFLLLSIVIFGLIIASHVDLSEIKSKLLCFYCSVKSQLESELDEPFLPEVNSDNMFVLERASDSSSCQLHDISMDDSDEENSDEVPTELLIPDSIPEIDEDSTDDDEDDLLPILPQPKRPKENSNSLTGEIVEYSQFNDSIEFKKGHFKRDSSLSTTSSSSEESLSKGLQFPDLSAIDGSSSSTRPARPVTTSSQDEANSLIGRASNFQSQILLANSSKIIPSLMSGLMQTVFGAGKDALPTHSNSAHDHTNRRVVTTLDSADEGDFVVVNSDDLP